MSDNFVTQLQAFDDHVRRHGYASLPEGGGILLVLEHSARQLGIPHMTDADRPVTEPPPPPPLPIPEPEPEPEPEP